MKKDTPYSILSFIAPQAAHYVEAEQELDKQTLIHRMEKEGEPTSLIKLLQSTIFLRIGRTGDEIYLI